MPSHVVVTGASSGIGAALALYYADSRAMLSLIGRDERRLQEVAAQCQAAGAVVATAMIDVRDAAAIDQWLRARDLVRSVDLLIANAGIGGANALENVAGEEPEAARRLIDINVLGVINTVTPLIQSFVQRRYGQIAIVSSIGGILGLPNAAAYSASKAAVRIYGDALRRSVSTYGVGVTIICPGFVATPMSASLPFQPPLMWSAERAARRIAAGLRNYEREILFPWQLKLAVYAAKLLPAAILDLTLNRLCRKFLGRKRG